MDLGRHRRRSLDYGVGNMIGAGVNSIFSAPAIPLSLRHSESSLAISEVEYFMQARNRSFRKGNGRETRRFSPQLQRIMATEWNEGQMAYLQLWATPNQGLNHKVVWSERCRLNAS